MYKVYKMISICLTVFNSEDTIEKCLKSISSDLLKNSEFCVVDAGSKDNTLKNIKKLKNELCDFEFQIVVKEACSIGEGRNIATKLAQGEYIIIVDADNQYLHLYELFLKFKKDIDEGNAITLYQSSNSNKGDIHLIMLLKSVFMRTGGYPDVSNAEDIIFGMKLRKLTNVISIETNLGNVLPVHGTYDLINRYAYNKIDRMKRKLKALSVHSTLYSYSDFVYFNRKIPEMNRKGINKDLVIYYYIIGKMLSLITLSRKTRNEILSVRSISDSGRFE